MFNAGILLYLVECNNILLMYVGYSEINVRWAVKKNEEERRKSILLYTKVSYIIRLLLDIITL